VPGQSGTLAVPDGDGAPPDGAVAPRGPQRGGLAVLQVLRHREFGIFWAGQAISLVGTWMQAFAQGWVVATLTASARALGYVNFAGSLPMLVLMPFGGVAADRRDRRSILIATQWAMLVLAAIMGALVAAHRLRLWHVYALSLALGVASAFDLPAYQAFYPQLVEREELPQAISLNQATFHGSRIIGPALAGAIVSLWGTASAFFANGASFLAVIVSLGKIRPRPAPAGDQPASTWSLMGEGIQYVRDRPRLQSLLGFTGITTLFIFPNLAVLMPYYIKYVLHAGPQGLGIMMSISGIGALLGAVLMLSVPSESRTRRIAMAAVVILGTMSVLAWARHLWIAVLAAAIQSLAIAQSLGLVSIIVQEMVPDALRGRVMSLYSMMFTGVMPFAALGVTALADSIGMRRELQLAGALYTLSAVILLWRATAAPAEK